MECKFTNSDKVAKKLQELIDTLWNVNSAKRPLSSPLSFELIDTLWNVNPVNHILVIVDKRINRYIMECKFF